MNPLENIALENWKDILLKQTTNGRLKPMYVESLWSFIESLLTLQKTRDAEIMMEYLDPVELGDLDGYIEEAKERILNQTTHE